MEEPFHCDYCGTDLVNILSPEGVKQWLESYQKLQKVVQQMKTNTKEAEATIASQLGEIKFLDDQVRRYRQMATNADEDAKQVREFLKGFMQYGCHQNTCPKANGLHNHCDCGYENTMSEITKVLVDDDSL
jgi:esterase/lipase